MNHIFSLDTELVELFIINIGRLFLGHSTTAKRGMFVQPTQTHRQHFILFICRLLYHQINLDHLKSFRPCRVNLFCL